MNVPASPRRVMLRTPFHEVRGTYGKKQWLKQGSGRSKGRLVRLPARERIITFRKVGAHS